MIDFNSRTAAEDLSLPFGRRSRIEARTGRSIPAWCLTLLLLAIAVPLDAQESGQGSGRTSRTRAGFSPRHNLFQLPSVGVALGNLNRPAGIRWEQKEIRGAVQELSKNAGVSIWIDRRIDPNIKIDLRPAATTTVFEVLESTAVVVGGSVGLVENIVYLGPNPQSAALVQAAAIRMHDALARAKHSSSTELRKFAWESVTTPAKLLRSIETNWQFTITGDVPYDLWHAMDHGTCSLATQTTLVLAGFDMKPTLRNSTIGFESLGGDIDWEYLYASTMLNPDSLSRRARLATLRQFGGSIRQQGDSFLVSGPSSLHLHLLRPANAGRAMQQNLDSRVVSLEVIKEFEPLMKELAVSIGFELKWSDALRDGVGRRRVEFSVKQVTVDQLLEKCAKSAGVQIKRTGSVVTVSP
ncbi:MAG: hypothetical protein ACE361_15725 [Aureliella sp.]